MLKIVAADIDRLAPRLTSGICHGDMTQDNVHLTDDQRFVFFDFDSAGQGWRASDFQGIYGFQKQADNGVWDAFLDGYTDIVTLTDADLAVLPQFVLIDALRAMSIAEARGRASKESSNAGLRALRGSPTATAMRSRPVRSARRPGCARRSGSSRSTRRRDCR